MKLKRPAVIMAGLAAILATWTGAHEILATPAGVAPAKPPATVVWVEQDGRARPFQNGERLTLGDVIAEIFVAPFPPLREGTIDLYLTDRGTGKPLDGKALRIMFDMDMPHGSIKAEALPTGGGHHLVPYKLVMPGQWRVEITIT